MPPAYRVHRQSSIVAPTTEPSTGSPRTLDQIANHALGDADIETVGALAMTARSRIKQLS
jgi:hypothetical protein